MATEDALPDWEDGSEVQTGDDSDAGDAEWLDLEPGDSVIGEVRAHRETSHDSKVIELARGIGDTVLLWSNGQIDSRLETLKDQHNGVEGLVLGFKKTEETRTFFPENSDDEVEFNVWEVRDFQ